ncbi:hypothetical protein PVAND_012012 [Polypedilum vanderplanki]|uniref:Coiled-coil domain-containing protein 13 n=1 Tax=Polypedilum vanderplanki TaxID=319348 RepID=A0A9J6CL23_POLVA|nr:hypothetical protein PVAND_012012 [Polypedilum vanderplanki]
MYRSKYITKRNHKKMSEFSYLPHPEDPSLVTVNSKHSNLTGDVHVKLNSKLQKLTQRNAKLHEKLAQKENEIAELKEKNEKINSTLNLISFECTPEQTQKIADLSKTNRQLSSQVIKARNKTRELETKVNTLEKILEEKEKLERECEKQEEEEKESKDPSELQTIANSLEKTRKKLLEVTNQNVQLKTELKMAHKCLQQEIGVENINLPQLLNSTSNWRGRADQISMLQRKIAEYKEKLEGTDNESSLDSSRTSLCHLDSIRRSEIEMLTKELEDCRTELENVKQKVVGLKARNKTLLDEGNNYKLKTLELMEKSKNDDDYIKCLNEKISMAKFECEQKLNEFRKEAAHVSQMKEEARVEVQKSQIQLQNMAEILNDKNNEIENLKLVNKELEDKLREISGDFLFSCRDMSKKKFVELVQGLEEEKASLTKLVQNFNDRLNQQISIQNEQHDIITKQKVKISRLEAKIKEFENEKEKMLKKHQRNIRINEYTRSMCGLSQSTGKSSEKALSEIDRLKFRLEFATEKIAFLEKKMKLLNEDRNEDIQKFAEIIGRSKEFFHELYRNNDDESVNDTSFTDSAIATRTCPPANTPTD